MHYITHEVFPFVYHIKMEKHVIGNTNVVIIYVILLTCSLSDTNILLSPYVMCGICKGFDMISVTYYITFTILYFEPITGPYSTIKQYYQIIIIFFKSRSLQPEVPHSAYMEKKTHTHTCWLPHYSFNPFKWDLVALTIAIPRVSLFTLLNHVAF